MAVLLPEEPAPATRAIIISVHMAVLSRIIRTAAHRRAALPRIAECNAIKTLSGVDFRRELTQDFH